MELVIVTSHTSDVQEVTEGKGGRVISNISCFDQPSDSGVISA